MSEPRPDGQPQAPVARLQCDAAELAAGAGPATGVLWKLAETGRQLDANVVRLAPGEGIATHAEPELDVLLLVVAGGGTVRTAEGPQALGAGAVLWLPHGSSRSFTAGPDGLAYVTVHRRRPGMQIRRRADLPPVPEPLD